jgi:hypothetical protein
MGGQEDLCREFAKAQPEVVRRTRARWMLLGVLMMFVFRAGQKTLQILPFLNWKLGIGPSIDIRLSSSFVDIVVWACGIYLFVRFANGGFARLAQWLNQRHKTARGLSTDLAFLIVVLIAAEMLWLLALGLDRAPSFGEMTLVFLNTGVPLLLATCAGIYWLHPMKGQVRV